MTNRVLATKANPGNRSRPIGFNDGAFLGALAAALLPTGRLMAEDVTKGVPGDFFVLLLQGLYQAVPAGEGPRGISG